MTRKTISGHYDAVFSLEHNNRIFTPHNVDPERSKWNYNCVAAGELAALDLETPKSRAAFWDSYRKLAEIYWEDRTIARKRAYEEYQEQLAIMRRYRYACRLLTDDGLTTFMTLLFLPLLIPCGIYMNYKMEQAREIYDQLKEEQWIRDMEFKAAKLSFREAISEQDRIAGTEYLQVMDSVVREMAQQANDYLTVAKHLPTADAEPARYATLEEIYDKLFEPSFRAFQNKQRPCRRYEGTYLESIREGYLQETRKKQQSRNTKMRKTAEAIEIVFGIGDMDNTGYKNAYSDAKQSEVLLKDFCDHLLEDPHLCVVTTKELENPDWRPPFKNGMIILNLTAHCDEATPGVHLTMIPYSSGCKRGPAVQAALGRALTGMGYPSTWINALDNEGKPIPKRTRAGELVYNQDGAIRYRQVPDKQGIIDWIEEQKRWLQKEMQRRYGWEREYKGSHPRGNLSTPDYQVARAMERKQELEKATKAELGNYAKSVREYSIELHSNVQQMYADASELERVTYYLKHCPEADYQRLMQNVDVFWSRFAMQEDQKARDSLVKRLWEMNEKAQKKGSPDDKQARHGYPSERGQQG